MHRIGFRRVSPLAFTAVHVVLIWFALTHQQSGSTGAFQDSVYRPVAYQEGTVTTMVMREPQPLKPAQKTALILELPALFLAMLIAALLFPRNDMAWLYTSIAFVPFLWYGIGRWLDGLLGYIEPLYLPRLLRRLFAFLAAGLLCISVIGLTPIYRHRTADTYWVFTGFILWAGLCLAIMLSGTARRLSD